MAWISPKRNRERGITILLVAVAMFTILAVAALSVDIVTLYVARSEAQRAADAAAVAGAKMFVISGFTSGQLGAPDTGTVRDQVCINAAGPGGAAIANKQAEVVASLNQIAGQPASIQSISCSFGAQGENPQITVTVQRTGLPTFFARAWGNQPSTVIAKATAEAVNPSGPSPSVPIQVASVKPWLIPNCDPHPSAPPGSCTPTANYFVNTADGSLNNPSAYIGQTIPFPFSWAQQDSGAPPSNGQFYYALSVPIDPPAAACPASGLLGCNQIGIGPYYDNIACSSKSQFSCGQIIGAAQPVSIDTRTGTPVLQNRHAAATQCLIHASNPLLGSGQDEFIASGTGTPVSITGGDNNPNPSLRDTGNISRSDSIVTVPLYDGHNMCPGGTCTETATIIGFLQLGITQGDPGGAVKAVILNAAGCNPGATGNPISGGGISPIPVRLIHQ